MLTRIQNLSEFKTYILRKLGAPVITINVADEQVTDRVYDAIALFNEWHYDGMQEGYLPYSLVAQDILQDTSLKIDLGANNNIQTVVELINSQNTGALGLPNASLPASTYFAMSDALNSGQLNTSSYIATLEQIGDALWIFDKKEKVYWQNQRYIIVPAANTSRKVGDKLLFRVYYTIDPDSTDAYVYYNSRWLRDYAVALVKEQWGSNLLKYNTVPLPGGMTLNAEAILSGAQQDIATLKQELENYKLNPLTVWA